MPGGGIQDENLTFVQHNPYAEYAHYSRPDQSLSLTPFLPHHHPRRRCVSLYGFFHNERRIEPLLCSCFHEEKKKDTYAEKKEKDGEGRKIGTKGLHC